MKTEINLNKLRTKRGTASVMQIMFLVIGIVAVAWIIGSEIGVVSGAEINAACDTTTTSCSGTNRLVCSSALGGKFWKIWYDCADEGKICQRGACMESERDCTAKDWTFTAWFPVICPSNGVQTRTVHKTNENCIGDVGKPTTKRTCNAKTSPAVTPAPPAQVAAVAPAPATAPAPVAPAVVKTPSGEELIHAYLCQSGNCNPTKVSKAMCDSNSNCYAESESSICISECKKGGVAPPIATGRTDTKCQTYCMGQEYKSGISISGGSCLGGTPKEDCCCYTPRGKETEEVKETTDQGGGSDGTTDTFINNQASIERLQTQLAREDNAEKALALFNSMALLAGGVGNLKAHYSTEQIKLMEQKTGKSWAELTALAPVAAGFDVGGFIWGNLQAASIALGVVQIFGLLAKDLFGLEQREINSASFALASGFLVGGMAKDLATHFATDGKFLGMSPKTFGLGVGLITGALVFYATYKKEKTEVVTFTCETWQAPSGGNNCQTCNKQGLLPCSEYQCRALGQGCQLLNKGETNELCTWVNSNDITPPTIEPIDSALLADFKYTPDKTISPPDRGVKIEYTKAADTCMPAFTPFTFGIKTNEPTICKIDYNNQSRDFKNMTYYFDNSNLFDYTHNQTLSLPGPKSLEGENLTMENDGQFDLFVRCQDANGNSNEANFVFRYCVTKGPDTLPPVIVRTEPTNDVPIQYNKSSVNVNVYTNEPATCKWDHLDRDYDDMETDMVCAKKVTEINAQNLYKCTTTLTGLKDRQDNKFFFRCKDKPNAKDNDRIKNEQSYAYTLIGTQPLVIDEVSPNATTIKDSTDSIKVELKVDTSAGYKEGESACYYSQTGLNGNYVLFLGDEGINQYEHKQELWLAPGSYTFGIRCVDLGGNADEEEITFTTEADSTDPIVVRAYHDSEYLKLVTNENATCVYGTEDCNYLFDDGISMVEVGGDEHYTDWVENTNFYVKCQDEFGNQPAPDACSIVVRPFRSY